MLYPWFGIMLQPEWSALLMSLSSIIVATNAVLLKRVEPALDRDVDAGGRMMPGAHAPSPHHVTPASGSPS